jgi:hypothetical protein
VKSATSISFWHLLAIATVLIALRFYPAVLEGRVMVFGDNYSLQVPGKVFTSYWLKQGVIPWWNPTIFAGIPWTQELSQTVFYPTTLLFMFIHPGHALNLSIASHLLFTFFGMYLLVRKWVKSDYAALFGAILWTFSTQVTGSSNNLVTIQAIAWFPWISYWGLRLFESPKNSLIFSLFVLGQFLAGYPQHVVYAIFLAVILSVIQHWKKISLKKWLIRWVVAGVYTLSITAVAWLPFAEVLHQSTRVIQTTEQASAGSLNPLMLIKVFLPYFFDNPAAGMKWGPAWSGFPNVLFYFTWMGLILIIHAIRKKNSASLIAITALTIFISMGENFPLFSIIQKVVPFFRVSRGPSIILVATTILLILVIAKELANLKFTYKNRILVLIFSSSFLLLVISWLLPQVFESMWNTLDLITGKRLSLSPFHTIERDQILLENVLSNAVVNALLFGFFLIAMKRKQMIVGILIIGIDLIFNTQGMLFFAPQNVYPTWKEINQSISNQHQALIDPNYRTLTRNMNSPYTDYGMYWEAMTVRAPFSDSFIDSEELRSATYLKQIRDSYTPDWNMVFQLPVIHGYTTLLPSDFESIWQVDGVPGINAIDKITVPDQKLSEWSVRNYIVDKQFEIKETLPDSEPIHLSDTVDLYALAALPRFRYEDNSAVDLTTLEENPNLISLTIENQAHEIMLIADRYDPNWRLTINGEDKEIVNANGMRQFVLSQGRNEIKMEFVPMQFFRGFIISGLSIIAILFYIFKRRDSDAQIH